MNGDPKVKLISINITIVGEGSKGRRNAYSYSQVGYSSIKELLIENGLRKNIEIARGEVGSAIKNSVTFDVLKK